MSHRPPRPDAIAEALLWRALRQAMPHENWRRQVAVGPYFVDFASHRARLVVEVDRSHHDVPIDCDAARASLLKSQGYRVLHFWNAEVLQNLGGVVAAIHDALPSPLVGDGRSRAIGPRSAGDDPRRSRRPRPHGSTSSHTLET